MNESQTPQIASLAELMSEESPSLLDASGTDLVRRIGVEAVRTVVFDVLSGRNLRDSTEMLTRRRLAVLNAATVSMLVKGAAIHPDFIEQLPSIAARILEQGSLSKAERWVAQWALGLTDKASQNVLRDDASLLEEYKERYIVTCEEVIRESVVEFGNLGGEVRLGDEFVADITWKFMVYLLGTVGAQTLTIRGSEKSAYGKLFERLVLGSLLHILGFRFTGLDGPRWFEREFWLSSQRERRESDATALWQAGQGARFDIGFIGRGNPELSLDKVSRFAREVELGRTNWYMATVIIVDRIGRGSRIKDLAREVDGDIVQMSMAYWPQEVAEILNRRMEFEHPLVEMPRSEIRDYLREAMKDVPLADFLP
jgi:hypothetical protein